MIAVYRISAGEQYYFGSAVNLEKRSREHVNKARLGTHRNFRLQRVWDKYGKFDVEVIEECDTHEQALELEQLLLDVTSSDRLCMNIRKSVSGGGSESRSAECRAKMSEAGKQYWANPENRRSRTSTPKACIIHRDGEEPKTFSTLTEAVESVGRSPSWGCTKIKRGGRCDVLKLNIKYA